MAQGDYIDLHRKRFGRRFDYYERLRKRVAREGKNKALKAKTLKGIKAKLYHEKQRKEKAALKRSLSVNKESKVDQKVSNNDHVGAIPSYLMDRTQVSKAKILSNMLKQKRKEKAGKWEVPLPKVKPISEAEVFKVYKSGKRQNKSWKRLVTKATFVGENFTRKPPKYERFIRPAAMRFTKAHVTHPELKATFCMKILGVKKNPQSPLYTTLGIMTKGSIIEVDVSELGLVTATGKVVWGKYAQITNNPENDGCVNAVLLV
ncbi:TGF-beta-inducible nuclear protein, putative [Entamoeba invadens IP1]|uniref:Ribosome biogenesis protein NSA2 homolog n=1 Tax=Entamoeba invadens IP1 TaxID=370355 RepID=A0A0A1TYI1_ENTIV|nr:TGF-beta-inducible nuclear protein, putative [Entamoeba invadens IP1]ELP86576.1 TGF-beta-inducible nuclear protein, putative [Entamoeba invadens IP1]|eukprot:XP_004185922.1 TGF-beta-inducible nuclear protein, putative [Entamoeba invadens IP1]